MRKRMMIMMMVMISRQLKPSKEYILDHRFQTLAGGNIWPADSFNMAHKAIHNHCGSWENTFGGRFSDRDQRWPNTLDIPVLDL